MFKEKKKSFIPTDIVQECKLFGLCNRAVKQRLEVLSLGQMRHTVKAK